MPQFQPRPMVVIRNQLLAFLVLHLLGSCAPMNKVEAPMIAVAPCCPQMVAASHALASQKKPLTLTIPTR
jgi:hypothetical protein